MTDVITQDGKILLRDGAIAATQSCCCEGSCDVKGGTSGGAGTTVNVYKFPAAEHKICLRYDALAIPDRFIVEACGTKYIDTGSVSGAGCRQFTKPAGCTDVKVTVEGPDNTRWSYTIACCTCCPEGTTKCGEECCPEPPDGHCCTFAETDTQPEMQVCCQTPDGSPWCGCGTRDWPCCGGGYFCCGNECCPWPKTCCRDAEGNVIACCDEGESCWEEQCCPQDRVCGDAGAQVCCPEGQVCCYTEDGPICCAKNHCCDGECREEICCNTYDKICDQCFCVECAPAQTFSGSVDIPENRWGACDGKIYFTENVQMPAGCAVPKIAVVTGGVDDELTIDGEPIDPTCPGGQSVYRCVKDKSSFTMKIRDNYGVKCAYDLTVRFYSCPVPPP